MSVSCNKNDDPKKDDPEVKTEYAFYKPIMEWNVGMEKIRSEMNKMADWVEDAGLSDETELGYVNKKNKAPQITYKFETGKMTECSISYLSCNDKFDQMKTDWAKELNLTWKESEILGLTIYRASSEPNNCRVIAQKQNASGFDIMTITFYYEEIFFE